MRTPRPTRLTIAAIAIIAVSAVGMVELVRRQDRNATAESPPRSSEATCSRACSEPRTTSLAEGPIATRSAGRQAARRGVHSVIEIQASGRLVRPGWRPECARIEARGPRRSHRPRRDVRDPSIRQALVRLHPGRRRVWLRQSGVAGEVTHDPDQAVRAHPWAIRHGQPPGAGPGTESVRMDLRSHESRTTIFLEQKARRPTRKAGSRSTRSSRMPGRGSLGSTAATDRDTSFRDHWRGGPRRTRRDGRGHDRGQGAPGDRPGRAAGGLGETRRFHPGV